jgi:uncharacterized coiled-coil DUF342 family protein
MILFILKLRLKAALWVHNRSLSKVCETLIKVINQMSGPMNGWTEHNELVDHRRELIAQRDVLIERIEELKNILKVLES